MEPQTIYHKNQNSITVKKLSKGYGWEIKVYGGDSENVISEIEKIDGELRKKFLEETNDK